MSLRTTGSILLIGALGLILANILQLVIPGPAGLSGPNAIPVDLLAVVVGLIAIIGLPALYRIQGAKAGAATRVGVALLTLGTLGAFVIGTAVQFLDVAFRGSVPHDRPHGPPTFVIIIYVGSFISYLIGGLVVGIAALRNRALPPGASWLLIIGVALLIPANVAFPNDRIVGAIAQNLVVSLMFAAWAWVAALAMAQQPASAAPTSSRNP